MTELTDTYFEFAELRADLASHDAWGSGVPHGTFARLRAESPVAWIDDGEGGGYWGVFTYADIVDVSRRFETFTSQEGIRLEQMSPEETEARRTLMETDPPEHTRLRRQVTRVFTRRAVEEYEQQIRDLAIEVVDEAIEHDEFDVVEAVAKQLPMRMLGKLLGTPDEDGEHLVELGDALLGNSDPEFTEHVVDQVDTDEFRMLPFRSPAGVELFGYAKEQADLRRECPGHDVISKLMEETKQGDHLTENEFQNFFTLLVAAGNDTTRYTMAGMMKAMIEYPQHFDALRGVPFDDDAWRLATEEVLRWTTVTTHFRRTATTNTELHGKQITAGDRVVVYYASGDFDEEKFPHPYRFDLQRTPNDHLAFGRGGPHRCLGEWLARMEIRVLMQEWLARVASIEQRGPEEYLRSNFVAGIKHLPVAIKRV